MHIYIYIYICLVPGLVLFICSFVLISHLTNFPTGSVFMYACFSLHSCLQPTHKSSTLSHPVILLRTVSLYRDTFATSTVLFRTTTWCYRKLHLIKDISRRNELRLVVALFNPNPIDNKGSWRILKDCYCSVTMLRVNQLQNNVKYFV